MLFADDDEEIDSANKIDDNKRSSSTFTSPPRSGTTTPPMPSMSMIVGLKYSGSQRYTYCGDLTFLDCQIKFMDTFGSSPFLLNQKPIGNGAAECMTCVRDYVDKCMLGVFLAICREDYVEAEDVGSKRKLVREICNLILNIEQEYTAPGKGKVTETPDELYAQYIGIVAGLTDDVTMWLITLCSAYFSALTMNLKDKMDEGGLLYQY